MNWYQIYIGIIIKLFWVEADSLRMWSILNQEKYLALNWLVETTCKKCIVFLHYVVIVIIIIIILLDLNYIHNHCCLYIE